MAKNKAPSFPKQPHRHRYQLRRRPKRYDPVIASDNTGVPQPQPEHDSSHKMMMVEPNVDTVSKTAETPQQKPKSGPVFSKMSRQRYSRRAEPYTSSPAGNMKTKNVNVPKTSVNDEEPSRIKIAEQPCIEPPSKVKLDPQGRLQQTKVSSIVVPKICRTNIVNPPTIVCFSHYRGISLCLRNCRLRC